MKNKNIGIVFLLLAFLFTTHLHAQMCDEVFISEYIEGYSYNKAIELYNPQSVNVNIDGYKILIYNNGLNYAYYSVPLSGMINSHSTFVVCRNTADPEYTDKADLLVSNLKYNGDDAIALVDPSGNLIDLIGEIGEDPGYGWYYYGSLWTTNSTLVRKSTVQQGVQSNPSNFNPNIEWVRYPATYTDDLGSHTSDCSTSGCLVNYSLQTMDATPGVSNGVGFVSDRGPVIFEDRFNQGTMSILWSEVTGQVNEICRRGKALYFNDASTRKAETSNFTLNGTITIDFDIAIGGSASDCEDADAGEDVYLEYSKDNGLTWNALLVLDAFNHFDWENHVTLEFETSGVTRFRWIQYDFNSTFDNWAIDNILIQNTDVDIDGVQWSNGYTENIVDNLNVGMHTVTITGTNGCEIVESFEIEEAPCTIDEILVQSEEPSQPDFNNGSLWFSVAGGQMVDDFSSATPSSAVWSEIRGAEIANGCNAPDGSALVFNGNKSGERWAQTTPMDLTHSTKLKFDLKIGQEQTPCEKTESGEDVRLYYSWDNGFRWGFLDVFRWNGYPNWKEVMIDLPQGMQREDVVFKWKQPHYSGKNWDVWSIDNIELLGENYPAHLYQAIWSNEETTARIHNLEPDDYTLYLSDQDGCVGRSTVYLPSEDRLTSVNSQSVNSSELKVYPNPATNEIFLQGRVEDFEDGVVQVVDVMGKVWLQQYLKSDEGYITQQNLQLPSLPNGTYMLQIIDENPSVTRFSVIR